MSRDVPDLPIRGLVPTAQEAKEFRDVRVVPPLGTAYAYRFVLHRSWSALEGTPSPAATPRLDSFVPIGAYSAFAEPLPPVIVSFGARLAPPDSPSLVEALRSYCDAETYEVLHVRPQRYVGGKALECLAQKRDPIFGLIKMRLAMLRDGGRLFGLSAMAPAAVYPDFVRYMSLALFSFELESAHGDASA